VRRRESMVKKVDGKPKLILDWSEMLKLVSGKTVEHPDQVIEVMRPVTRRRTNSIRRSMNSKTRTTKKRRRKTTTSTTRTTTRTTTRKKRNPKRSPQNENYGQREGRSTRNGGEEQLPDRAASFSVRWVVPCAVHCPRAGLFLFRMHAASGHGVRRQASPVL
jgi:hypothetical protein